MILITPGLVFSLTSKSPTVRVGWGGRIVMYIEVAERELGELTTAWVGGIDYCVVRTTRATRQPSFISNTILSSPPIPQRGYSQRGRRAAQSSPSHKASTPSSRGTASRFCLVYFCVNVRECNGASTCVYFCRVYPFEEVDYIINHLHFASFMILLLFLVLFWLLVLIAVQSHYSSAFLPISNLSPFW